MAVDDAASRISDVTYVRHVFDASYRRLVAQMYAISADLTAAEDAVQDAFVRGLARPGHFRRLDNPEAWLRTVAINQLRGRWRRLKLHRSIIERGEPETSTHPDLSPDHVALVAALRCLPAPQREAIVLHHIADLPIAEIARTLGVPIGTVKARLSRGRLALAKLIDESDSEEADRA